MKTLQNYIDDYREVAANLGYTGQSVEVLVQMLANASYLGEVENATYMKEASLEKCSLANSKIQHCVDNMYSVFRGSCPRVVLRIKPTKYLIMNPYDPIISSQTFKVYYLGYWDSEQEDVGDSSGIQNKFVYASKTFYPSLGDDPEYYTIIGFLAKESITTTWDPVDIYNTYYLSCLESNLSDDMYVTIEDKMVQRTRIFAEHILEHKVFDLTLPDFGSRIYFADYYKDSTTGRSSSDISGITTNANIQATYFKYTTLDAYNQVELKRLGIQGAELVSFDPDWLTSQGLEETSTGLSYIDAVPRDSINTIHYKASRDRYVNSILRSNSDIGTVLEESFPNVVKSGGTTYEYETSGNNNTSSINLYYIPKNEEKLLSEQDIEEFRVEKRAYYAITDRIFVKKGYKYTAIFNIDLETYNNPSEDWDSEIGTKILKDNYEKKFNITFDNSTKNEIISLISKISNIKKIKRLDITFLDNSNRKTTTIRDNAYFEIKYTISAIVTQTTNTV